MDLRKQVHRTRRGWPVLALAVALLAMAASAVGALSAPPAQISPSLARAAEARSIGTTQTTVTTLTVTNRESFARDNEPVTSGIPLGPETTATDVSDFALIGPEGPIESQMTVTARWGGGPGDVSKPIRWLLADFITGVPAHGSVNYELRRETPPAISDSIEVTESPDGITIDTGAARFFLSRTRFGLIDSMTLDGGPTRDLSGTPIVATDREGHTYSSTAAAPAALTIDRAGPLRTVVRAEGVLSGSAGTLVDCTAWLHFYRNASRVKVDLRIENRRVTTFVPDGQPDCWDIGSLRSVWIDDLSVRIPAPAAGITTATIGTGGGPINTAPTATVKLYQDSSGNSAWNRYGALSHPRLQSYTAFRGYRLTRGATTLFTGNHAPGWAVAAGPSGSTGVALRHFWQQFPKTIRIGTDGTAEIGLFPGEFASDHNFRAGEYKTHELLLDFDPSAGTFDDRAAALERPLVAAAPTDYYARTRAFGLTAPRREGTATAYEIANGCTIEPNAAYPYDWPPNGSMLDQIDAYDFYGWQDYGDVPLDFEEAGEGAGQMNLKYNFDWGMWLQWSRTGDARWLELADAASRHVADVDILHAPESPPHWSNGGFFGHSYHDEPGNSNPNRNYGAPHPDLTFGIPGTLSLYYMTGYEPARASAVEIADNISYRFDNTFGGNGEGYALGSEGVMNNNERPLANGLFLMTEAYRATGDAGYLATARAIASYVRAEDQPYIDGPTGSHDDFIKPAQINTLMTSLGRYLDMLDEFGLPDTEDAHTTLLRYGEFQLANTYHPLSGGRAAFPYEWYLDGTDSGPDICNWQMVAADAMTFAYRRSRETRFIDAASRLFVTGSVDTCFEGDEPVYWSTKEAANNSVFGHVYLATTWDGTLVSPTRHPTWLTAQASTPQVPYNGAVTIAGSLLTAEGSVVGRTGVALWGRPATGGDWARRATAAYNSSEDLYEASARCTQNTVFQVRFSGDASHTGSVSNGVTVRASAYLSRPYLTPRIPGHGRSFSIWGYLAPRHGGTTALYIYRQAGRSWRLYRVTHAHNAAYGSVTRYRLFCRITTAGRYLVRAYHSDTNHRPAWSLPRVFGVW